MPRVAMLAIDRVRDVASRPRSPAVSRRPIPAMPFISSTPHARWTARSEATSGAPRSLSERNDAVRAWTEVRCAPLATEDYVVSFMPDVSPTEWHLAHSSWCFETFALAPHRPDYRPRDPASSFLSHSYDVQAGEGSIAISPVHRVLHA